MIRHRWLLYSIVALGLSMGNAAAGIGHLWLHIITFVLGIVCFYIWTLKLSK